MKLCVIYSFAPHYRSAIFKLLDKEYDTSFFFGKKDHDIKKMDYSLLSGSVTELERSKIGPFSYMHGVPSLAFKDYSDYLLLLGPLSISSWLLLLLLKFSPKKHVYGWTHGWYGKENKFQGWLKKLNFKLADGIFVYGNYARDLMINEGFNPDKVHVIYNSLDYERQIELRNQVSKSCIFAEHFGNTNPVLIFIGRLTPVKRLDMLVQAVSKLRDQGSSYNLVFVGDGEERQALESMVSRFNIASQVWFYGACYDEDTNAELIYNADLCVAPGNVGLTAMHTMVFGTPVISHNKYELQMPEFEAIISGVTGDFFEYENQDSLTEAIDNWFKRNLSRDEIRQACYQEIDSKWNPNNQINIFNQYLNNLKSATYRV